MITVTNEQIAPALRWKYHPERHISHKEYVELHKTKYAELDLVTPRRVTVVVWGRTYAAGNQINRLPTEIYKMICPIPRPTVEWSTRTRTVVKRMLNIYHMKHIKDFNKNGVHYTRLFTMQDSKYFQKEGAIVLEFEPLVGVLFDAMDPEELYIRSHGGEIGPDEFKTPNELVAFDNTQDLLKEGERYIDEPEEDESLMVPRNMPDLYLDEHGFRMPRIDLDVEKKAKRILTLTPIEEHDSGDVDTTLAPPGSIFVHRLVAGDRKQKLDLNYWRLEDDSLLHNQYDYFSNMIIGHDEWEGEKLTIRQRNRLYWYAKTADEDEREQRARILLRDSLTEAEWRRYITNGFIMVKGKSGRWYQIFADHHRNRVVIYKNNEVTGYLCIHTVAKCPPSDHVINIRMLIQFDEQELYKLSNYRRAA